MVVLLCNEYIKDLEQQFKKYVYCHLYNNDKGNAYTIEDIVQEMLMIAWESYRNGNGLSKLIQEQKLVPKWQLHLIFLYALRRLDLLDKLNNSDNSNPNETACVIYDENGEIIDFWYPETDEPEEEEEEKESKIPQGKEKERWLEKIRKIKQLGYSDEEIIEMLKPIKQGVLF